MDATTLRLLQQLTDKVTQLESKLAATQQPKEPKRRRERPAGRAPKRSRTEDDDTEEENECKRVIPMSHFLRNMEERDSRNCKLDEDRGMLVDNNSRRSYTVDGYILTGKKLATVWDRNNHYWRNVPVL